MGGDSVKVCGFSSFALSFEWKPAVKARFTCCKRTRQKCSHKLLKVQVSDLFSLKSPFGSQGAGAERYLLVRAETVSILLLLILLQPYLQAVLSEGLLADHSISKDTLLLSAVHAVRPAAYIAWLPGNVLTISSHGVTGPALSLWRGGRGERQDRAGGIPLGIQIWEPAEEQRNCMAMGAN